MSASSGRTPRSPLLEHRSWPESTRARYREAGHWTAETMADFVDDRCRRFAHQRAVAGRDAQGRWQDWTYAALLGRTLAAQQHLASLGVEARDRVVVALPNRVEQVAVVLAAFRMGAVPVFALPSHRERELTHFCAMADAAVLVLPEGRESDDLAVAVTTAVARAGVVPPTVVRPGELPTAVTGEAPSAWEGDAEAVALLQLSGGTTGVSKLIPRTAADYLCSVRGSTEICGTDAQSCMLVVLPMAHNFSLSSPGVLGVLHVGGRVVLAPDASPGTAFRLVSAERVTTVALVPPLAQAWVAAAERRSPDLSALEVVQVGGAKLAPAVARQVGPVLGARLQQVFGMAEGLVNYTRDDDPYDVVTTTQGRPISEADEIRVVDASDHAVPPGQEGELLTRGPYTIRGYYGVPEADRTSFTDDGFYRTGDLVTLLPSGHLRVTGRVKDQINRAGEKIATVEVEEPLLAHPWVHDAVALGLPDPFVGEQVVAVVVPSVDLSVDQRELAAVTLTAHLRGHGLAEWKVPERFVLVDEFPATGVGKNSRRDLRALLIQKLTGSLPTPAPSPTAPSVPASDALTPQGAHR